MLAASTLVNKSVRIFSENTAQMVQYGTDSGGGNLLYNWQARLKAVAAGAASSWEMERFGMRAQPRKGRKHTVLVVADDVRILCLAEAALERTGHRVLVARDARSAEQLLARRRVRIDSVAIGASIGGHQDVQAASLRRGAVPWVLQCEVTDHSVQVKGLDTGDNWESAAPQLH